MDAKYFFQGLPRTAILVVTLLFVLLVCGCHKQPIAEPAAKQPNKTKVASTSPGAVLEKMIAAYQEAEGYSDAAILQLSYTIHGEANHDTASIAVRLARPNRARVQVYQADVACDGKQLTARISDEGTNDIDGQVVQRAAPTTLTLQNLLDDPVLYDAMASGLGRLPIQLELLLGKSPLEGFLAAGVKRRLLESDRVRGEMCYRVSVVTTDGEFVLWIDHDDSILRRLEYPPAFLTAQLPAGEEPGDVELVAEFDGARLHSTPEDESAFNMPVPKEARLVRYFVKPPQPLPSNLLGQSARDFQFSDLDGARWSSEQLANKTAVLHWYVDHPSCEASLRQWEQVRRKYADNPDIVFLAVCVEPSAVGTETIREVLRRWDVEAPVVRDLDAAGRDVFNISALPALVVLDGKQVVQAFDLTYNPELAQQLPTAIDQIIAGRDLATQVLAQVHNEASQYYQSLAAAGAIVNETSAPSRTVPAHWQIEQVWENPFHQPGNMVSVVQPDGSEHLLVLEEGRVVLELDENFRSSRTHRLPIPEGEFITHLRAAPDGSSFVAFSFGGRRAYWIDAQWQLIDEVPDIDVRHEGVRDVQLLRRGDQMLLTVATVGPAGILAQSRTGNVEWQLNEPLMQTLAMHAATGQFVGADANGRLVRIGPDGKLYPSGVDQTAIFQIWPITGAAGEEDATFVGVAYEASGMRIAYGLDDQLAPLWEYRLPADPFRFPVEFVSSGRLTENESPYCVLASADGAIHLVSADGREHDYFFTGGQVSGLRVFHSAEGPVVAVGSENAVTAWRLKALARATAAPASTELETIEE